MSGTDSWASRMGFVLASIGAAVGLGNVWQFPFKTAQNGGATFLVVYLLAALLVGIPALLAEYAAGRMGAKNAVETFDRFGGRPVRAVGLLSAFTGVWVFGYYAVAGGWMLRYALGSVTGGYVGDPTGYFATVTVGPEAAIAQGAFVAITVAVVGSGLEDGVEAASKLLVPAVVVVFGGLAVYAATLDGAAAGYAYFLAFDAATVRADLWTVLPAAVGHTFFSLMVGVAVMVTYATYVHDEVDLARDGAVVVTLDALVGVLAGLVVFPLLFAHGVDPAESGSGAVFIGVGEALAALPGGRVVGVAFFLATAVAGLSTSIGMLEALVAAVTRYLPLERAPAAVIVGWALFLAGLPAALSAEWFAWVDAVAYGFLLPFSVLCVLVVVGWLVGREAVAALFPERPVLGTVWLWLVRLLATAAVLAATVLGLADLVGAPV